MQNEVVRTLDTMEEESAEGDGGRAAICAWTGDLDFNSWETDCGTAFWLEEGTPTNAGMKFCCFCGKPLVTELAKDDPNDDKIIGDEL